MRLQMFCYGDSSFYVISKSSKEVVKSGTKSLIVEKYASNVAPRVFRFVTFRRLRMAATWRAILPGESSRDYWPVDESIFPFALGVHAGDPCPGF